MNEMNSQARCVMSNRSERGDADGNMYISVLLIHKKEYYPFGDPAGKATENNGESLIKS